MCIHFWFVRGLFAKRYAHPNNFIYTTLLFHLETIWFNFISLSILSSIVLLDWWWILFDLCAFFLIFFFWKKLVDRLYLLGKGRIEVGIHLLSPQICCESDKRKKVSPKRCVIICFRWCVLRFFSNCNFNVCSYLFIVLWVFCLFSVSIFFRAFEIIVLLSVFARCSASLICFYFFALTLMVFFVVVVVPFWLSSCIRQHYLNISKLRTSNTLLCSFEHTPKIHCMCTVQCTIPRLINSFAAAKSYSLAHRFNSIRKWQFFSPLHFLPSFELSLMCTLLLYITVRKMQFSHLGKMFADNELTYETFQWKFIGSNMFCFLVPFLSHVKFVYVFFFCHSQMSL